MEKDFKFDVGDEVTLPGNHLDTQSGEVFVVEKRWHGMTGEDAYSLRSKTRKGVVIDANGYHMTKVGESVWYLILQEFPDGRFAYIGKNGCMVGNDEPNKGFDNEREAREAARNARINTPMDAAYRCSYKVMKFTTSPIGANGMTQTVGEEVWHEGMPS